MNRRYAIYVGAIVLLVVVNVWRWGGHPASGTAERQGKSRIFMPEDFHVSVSAFDTHAAQRDLFRPGSAASNTKYVRRRHVKTIVLAPVPDEASIASQELGRLKLLGVVFHAGKARAYLAVGNENMIALAGDTVLGRFVVDGVEEDAVDLRDLKTNVTRRIPISGK